MNKNKTEVHEEEFDVITELGDPPVELELEEKNIDERRKSKNGDQKCSEYDEINSTGKPPLKIEKLKDRHIIITFFQFLIIFLLGYAIILYLVDKNLCNNLLPTLELLLAVIIGTLIKNTHD